MAQVSGVSEASYVVGRGPMGEQTTHATRPVVWLGHLKNLISLAKAPSIAKCYEVLKTYLCGLCAFARAWYGLK